MDDLACPNCKTTKYRNPSLKLLVNTCGHALCDHCVELLFAKGSGECPECKAPLRRALFRVQLFEDPSVEKEVDIRKKLLKVFCKQESDFSSLRDYNDYLEEVETVVFNLTNNLDILETNKKIETYKKENKEQIDKAKSRRKDDILELEEILEQEKLRAEMARIEVANMEKAEKVRRLKTQEALIDDLMFSDTDAKAIVASHKSMKNRVEHEDSEGRNNGNGVTSGAMTNPAFSSLPVSFTSGIGFGHGRSSFLPVPKAEEIPLYTYEELKLDLGGLPQPSTQQLKDSSYLNHIKAATKAEIAGGFHPSIACCRALQDAFSDISFQPKLLLTLKTQPETTETPETEPMDMDTS